MKDVLKAVIAMAVIIMVQVILSYVFTYQVAEKFSKAAIVALFYYYICKRNNGKLKPSK